MQKSENIHTELVKCEAILESMSYSNSASDFDDKWQQLLGYIERIWNKCNNHFMKSPKWSGWKGRFEIDRKNDPLLSYLKNARGAHEHAAQEEGGASFRPGIPCAFPRMSIEDERAIPELSGRLDRPDLDRYAQV